MVQAGIESIRALYELERHNWRTVPIGKDEVRCKCPLHGKDDTPSVGLNVSKNLWMCYTCKKSGDIVSLIAHITKAERSVVLQELSTRYELEEEKEIPAQTVETYHQFFLKTLSQNPLFTELQKRGITVDMIREARIGFDGERIMIPVYDLHHRIVNIRKYLPGAPKQKVKNMQGFGKSRLYQIEELAKYEKVIICGGEMKALLAKWMLSKHGFAAVAPAAGEGAWDQSWNMYFKGKIVFICMDIDNAGLAGSRRVAEQIYSGAKEVRIMALPMDRAKYPKGDLSDYVAQEGATDADLLKVINLARVYEPITVSVEIDKGDKEVSLASIADPSNVDFRLEFTGVVSAMDSTPYLVPKEVWTNCDRSQPNCYQCPIKREEPDANGYVKKVISPTAKGLLETINVNALGQHKGIRASLGIPTCKSVQFEVRDHYSVVDARLSPQLEISNESSGIQQPAFLIGSNVDMNLPYIFKGKVYPNPLTQQAVCLVNEMTETADSLARYSLTEKDRELLKIFSCAPTKEFVQAKLDTIYTDLENNVTRILSRRDLHLLVDLVYHSPLYINYDGRRLNGWVNALICGDSAQGKSETTTKLKQHYGLGERIECKNATSAGLVGGVQQLNGRWFITWGVIPVNDRRLVILEEIKGASTEIIGKLTDMRSSGIAEIPKIERRRANARTRLIFISNPRKAQQLSAHNFGIEALQDLIGSLEDIRRFDAAILLASEDVDLQDLVLDHKIPHKYTSEICHKLVLYAWTLKEQDIILAAGVEEQLRIAGLYFSDRFTEAFPLVDKGTIKHKLLRLATALAIRLYSVNEKNQLVVHPAHVQYIQDFLDRTYSSPRFGYLEFTRSQLALSSIPNAAEVVQEIQKMRFPDTFVNGMLAQADINLMDIQDFVDIDRDAAQTVLSFFVRNHCLRRNKGAYAKTPAFIQLLKNVQPSKKAKKNPDF